ncbi:hypothetical protein CEXT_57621 [Caerostris extrusa]|uniref:Uncharacterized protein n=1 Tax=Caerostris extrusa TaxID=172846 RepID=A0AAV4TQ01_CAEEX|nr:hypothetical protein CEXT_57621 [Caerostris extrusa]
MKGGRKGGSGVVGGIELGMNAVVASTLRKLLTRGPLRELCGRRMSLINLSWKPADCLRHTQHIATISDAYIQQSTRSTVDRNSPQEPTIFTPYPYIHNYIRRINTIERKIRGMHHCVKDIKKC